MKRVIGHSRYAALAGVFIGAVAALIAWAWAAVKSAKLAARLVTGQLDGMAVGLVQVMDGLLIGAGLLIFALGLYELFIGDLALPEWLVFRDLDALKAKLAGVIVLVMAVAFLEQLEAESHNLLQTGIAVALVSAVLTWMGKK